MSTVELQALLPLLILAGAATLTLVAAPFLRRPTLVSLLAGAGLLAFLGAVAAAWPPQEPVMVAGQLVIDAFALLFWALLGGATLVLLVYNHGFHRDDDEAWGETAGLFLLALLGGCVLAASRHFAAFFMGLELLSVSLFILIAWQCRRAISVEAGIKYLVLAGLASGFLLFGMALVFATAGTLSFPGLAQLGSMPVTEAWWLAGLALLMLGLAFKLSLAPFQFWTPDVYQGASLPVTAFLATVSKLAALAVLTRLLVDMELVGGSPLWQMLAVLAGLSMLAGNWLALRQEDVKRLLAYSSIAHMGYALAALLAGTALAVEAVIFYAFFYLATTLAAFGSLAALEKHDAASTPTLTELRGLIRRRPLPALVMALAMLSLAGVPLTGGFIGKFYVLASGAADELWWLMLLVIAGSAIGLFYYLRVLLALFSEAESRPTPALAPAGSFCLLLLALAVLWLGVLPGHGMELARAVAADLMPMTSLVAGAP